MFFVARHVYGPENTFPDLLFGHQSARGGEVSSFAGLLKLILQCALLIQLRTIGECSHTLIVN